MERRAPEWNRPLQHRRGATQLLGALDVFFDFDWIEVFLHNRAIFPGGRSLSELVHRECPEGKCPTLLLTDQDDVSLCTKVTADRYILVVQINDYLRNAGADAALTYLARLSTTPLTRLADVHYSPVELAGFIEEILTSDMVAEWAAGSSDRMIAIREIAGTADQMTPENVVAALRGLAAIDNHVIDAVVEYLGRFDEEEGVRNLLHRLTQSEFGRTTATAVIADRLMDRISDTRVQLAKYNELINTPGISETEVQRFLESNHWIVGLTYVGTRSLIQIPRGEIDFVLNRFDGFFDIVELKGPEDKIIIERGDSNGDRPLPASAYSLGPNLANALAQAHQYRSILQQCPELVKQQYGLSDPRQSRILILLGRSTDLSDSGKEILRQLNLTLHRVEVIPYDLLGFRSECFLNNIESLVAETTNSQQDNSAESTK